LVCEDSTSCKKKCVSASDCVSGVCDDTTGVCGSSVSDAGTDSAGDSSDSGDDASDTGVDSSDSGVDSSDSGVDSSTDAPGDAVPLPDGGPSDARDAHIADAKSDAGPDTSELPTAGCGCRTTGASGSSSLLSWVIAIGLVATIGKRRRAARSTSAPAALRDESRIAGP
jgi:MYXO-CTERM domain-containing protein